MYKINKAMSKADCLRTLLKYVDFIFIFNFIFTTTVHFGNKLIQNDI